MSLELEETEMILSPHAIKIYIVNFNLVCKKKKVLKKDTDLEQFIVSQNCEIMSVTSWFI